MVCKCKNKHTFYINVDIFKCASWKICILTVEAENMYGDFQGLFKMSCQNT